MPRYKSCTEYWVDPETGKFRGDFENMYRDIDDPWGCESSKSSLNNRLFLDLIFDGDRKFERVLDVGCGLGGLLSTIRARNGGGEILGVDVSSAAIEKASKRYPEMRFRQANIVTDDLGVANFNLIAVSEVLWYILDDLPKFYDRLAALLAKGGTLAIHQYFPAQQRFGRDKLDGDYGYLKFMRGRAELTKEHLIRADHPDGHVMLATFTKGD